MDRSLARHRGRRVTALGLVVPSALLLATSAPGGERGLDALAVSAYVAEARACIGESVPPTLCHSFAASVTSVAIGDLDADGDPDVALNRHGEPARTCLNADGLFTCTPIATSEPELGRAVLGDINRDGRMDVVLGARSSLEGPWAQVCYNFDGVLFFCGHLDDAVDFSHENLAVGDVNGDGAPDLVTAGLSKVCLNDGDGLFEPCIELLPSDSSHTGVALGDLDADGHLDVVIATNVEAPHFICLGDGDGHFACAPTPDLAHWSVDIGDVDGNGTLDLVFADGSGGLLCPGPGTGSFPACFPLAAETAFSRALSLADLDGDGRAEIAFANYFVEEPNRICRFLGYGPGGEPELDCQVLDPVFGGPGVDVALWTPWIFQDGFESGDVGRWSTAVQ